MNRLALTAYQFSVRTARPPAEVLDDLAAKGLAGITVIERGTSYLVLGPRSRRRHGGDVALGLGIAILCGVLLLTAVQPWLIILAPLCLAPALPMWLDHRPTLAVSAVTEVVADDAIEHDAPNTLVTAHGQASADLAAALDAYFGALPAPSSQLVESAPH